MNRVAIYQFPTGDLDHNLAQIDHFMAKDLSHLDLVLLPEMFVTGFLYEDMERNLTATDKVQEQLLQKAATDKVTICGSIMERLDGKLFNSLVCWSDTGTAIHLYRKRHLFFYLGEKENFEAGTNHQVFDFHDWNIAGVICFDLRFAELFASYQRQGADLFLLPAQWPGKRIEHWKALIRARAIETQSVVIACNAFSEVMGGYSMIVNEKGEILAEAQKQTILLEAEISQEGVKKWRQDFPICDHRLALSDYFPDM